MAAAAKSQSFIPIIERIDAFPYIQNDPTQYKEFIKSFYYFMIEDYAKPFGYVHVNRVQATTWPPYWRFNHTARTLTLTGTDSLESRTALLRDTLYSAHLEGKIKSLRKWSEETFSVYGRDNERFMDIPMIGAGFYGVVCTGVSLIAWTGAAGHRRY
ncbi:putative thiamin pyrophosphokinase-related protein [Rosellinia necatrix]|uniref:Putative thiamin pyrophosphokinase-related protein n=1 Tax=Rosellinia necatrix TaxID=77044 RepID=A0A1S8AAA9_ROSNE|nr:putative thiamin pyrophosphokinase-related protein [Rosellinia necatrix]